MLTISSPLTPYSFNNTPKFQRKAMTPPTPVVDTAGDIYFGRWLKRNDKPLPDLVPQTDLSRRQLLSTLGKATVATVAAQTLYELVPFNPFNPAWFINDGLLYFALAGNTLNLKDILNKGLLYKVHTAEQVEEIAKGTANGVGQVVRIPAKRNPNFLIRTVVMKANPNVPLKDTVILKRGADNGDREGKIKYERDRLFAVWLQSLGYNVVIVHHALKDEQGRSIADTLQNLGPGRRQVKLERAWDLEECQDADLKQIVEKLQHGLRIRNQEVLPPIPANRIVLAGRSLGAHQAVRVGAEYPESRVACFNMPASMPEALHNLIRNETTPFARTLGLSIDAITNNVNAAADQVKELAITIPTEKLVAGNKAVFIAEAERSHGRGGDLLVGVGSDNSARNLYDNIRRSNHPDASRFQYYGVPGAAHDSIFQIPGISSDTQELPTDPNTRLGKLVTAFTQFLDNTRT